MVVPALWRPACDGRSNHRIHQSSSAQFFSMSHGWSSRSSHFFNFLGSGTSCLDTLDHGLISLLFIPSFCICLFGYQCLVHSMSLCTHNKYSGPGPRVQLPSWVLLGSCLSRHGQVVIPSGLFEVYLVSLPHIILNHCDHNK